MIIKPLILGKVSIWPPVVLAPMAGVTHYPFRKLCRQFGNCLTVSEMVIARPLTEDNTRTLKIAQFGDNEFPRSIQLYGIDAYHVGEAVKRLVAEGRVDHIDLNFGCPVKKVTKCGGGAALPYKKNLLSEIIQYAVKNAGDIPVTVKCRLGIDDDHLTYLETGRIAENEGCAAIGLHARTAAQLYSGKADWQAIKKLKDTLAYIPVLGNGDIFTPEHALQMIEDTGCDGVIIGRGCLGRPWLFQEIQNVFTLYNDPNACIPPAINSINQVVIIMLQHLSLMIEWFGEHTAILKFRKEAYHYLNNFSNSAQLRAAIILAKSFSEMEQLLNNHNLTDQCIMNTHVKIVNKKDHKQIVALPPGFLDHPESLEPIVCEAESDISGG